MKKTVYIAGPLFSKSGLDYNLQLNDIVIFVMDGRVQMREHVLKLQNLSLS
ncbi:MAG: hypothetical protein OIN88_01585 [Candidatus Methanoperedens sp.]|nr:hypothetical protein [Candidatus Methanoperedens sp.]MCZ7358452.1 hypothetical protein [Candidatus Methanoperedens sp.]HLB70766.1 hypothetical protein [Candidatus Methanoperedens sp.]